MTDDKPAGPDKAVEQPATDQSPENAPEALGEPGLEVRAVGERHGMFGVKGSGDTSGYGGLVAPVVLPGAAQRPYAAGSTPSPTGSTRSSSRS